MRLVVPLTLTLLVTGLPFGGLVPAGAQVPRDDGPPQEPERRYRVEMILYALTQGNTTDEDLFHGIDDPNRPPAPALMTPPPLELESLDADGAQPQGDQAGRAGGPGPADPADPALEALPADRFELIERANGATAAGTPGAARASSSRLPPAFRPLAADEFEMTDIASRIRRVPLYRLVAHFGYEQGALEESRAVPVDLGRLGIANVDGTVTLWVGRFLHVGVDLTFHEGSGTRWIVAPSPGLAPLEYSRSFRLQGEINAIRSNEADPRGIDHPAYGVLVIVRPAPEPGEPAEGGNGPAA